MLLLWSLTAVAAGPGIAPRARPTTPEALIADLLEGKPSDQLFAVRELRRLTRQKLTDLKHRDPVRSLEAKQFLVVFDEQLAPACVEHLSAPKLRAQCADILSLLETKDALPALYRALPDANRRSQRRIMHAIEAIEES